MRLYRACCKREIEVLKSKEPLRLSFGSNLYNYIASLNNNLNVYKFYNQFWSEFNKSNYDEKLVYEKFEGLPKNIKLFYEEKRKFWIEELDFRANEIMSFPFLTNINILAFFENPFMYECVFMPDKSSEILCIEIPQKLANKFKGMGEYNSGLYDEFAIPTYLIKPEYIVDNFEFKSSKYEKSKKSFENKLVEKGQKIEKAFYF